MPSVVTISGTGSVNNGTVTYRYLADGTKLSAICSNGTGRLYRGSFVYGRQTAGASWREESVAWDGGRIFCGARTYDPVIARFSSLFSDHFLNN